uniref:WG repeat-containing protein n=1 Tax=Clostridium perfringens TaxID=1502 RepID=UPI0039EA1F20
MRYKKICGIFVLLAIFTFTGCSVDNKLGSTETFQNEDVNGKLANDEFKTYSVTDKNGNVGLIDEDGNIIIEPSYNHISPFEKDVAIFINDGNYGVINRKGEIELEPIYESITNLGDGYLNVKPDEYTDYIYDSNGQLILEATNNYIDDSLLDTTNSIIEYLGEDLFAIKNENNKVKVVNKENEVLIPYESNYSKVKLSKDDVLIVEKMESINASVQYLKLNGEPLINDIFERAYPFQDGIAVVVKDNKAGAIDKNGKEVIKFEFDNLSQFENGVSIANLSNNYGIINSEGEFTVEPKYKVILNALYNELYIAELDGKYGVIDKNDNIKIPFEYDMIYNLIENIFLLELDNKTSLVNKKNQVVLPLDLYEQA